MPILQITECHKKPKLSAVAATKRKRISPPRRIYILTGRGGTASVAGDLREALAVGDVWSVARI
jgi:hypothetical protein